MEFQDDVLELTSISNVDDYNFSKLENERPCVIIKTTSSLEFFMGSHYHLKVGKLFWEIKEMSIKNNDDQNIVLVYSKKETETNLTNLKSNMTTISDYELAKFICGWLKKEKNCKKNIQDFVHNIFLICSYCPPIQGIENELNFKAAARKKKTIKYPIEFNINSKIDDYKFSKKEEQRFYEVQTTILRFGMKHYFLKLGEFIWEVQGTGLTVTGSNKISIWNKVPIKRFPNIVNTHDFGFTSISDFDFAKFVFGWLKKYPNYAFGGHYDPRISNSANCQDFTRDLSFICSCRPPLLSHHQQNISDTPSGMPEIFESNNSQNSTQQDLAANTALALGTAALAGYAGYAWAGAAFL